MAYFTDRYCCPGRFAGATGNYAGAAGPESARGNLYYLHYVYGGIVALAIPVAISYATGKKNLRRDILIYSIAALILAAAGARATMTGLGLP